MCQRQDRASSAATPVQLSLPHSAAASESDEAVSAATPVQPSMPHSAAARASELPSQALDQARQAHQLLADAGADKSQIEALSSNQEILPCATELKICTNSPKRQCNLTDICTETVCSFVC